MKHANVVPEAPVENGHDASPIAISDLFPGASVTDGETRLLPVALARELREVHAEQARLETRRLGLIRGYCHAVGIDPETATYDLVAGTCASAPAT